MIPGRFTLDTNILIYATDPDAGVKHRLAMEIVRRSTHKDCRLTLQSVSEFYSAVTRKRMMEQSQALAQVEDWLTLFPTMPLTAKAIRAAMIHSQAGRTSYWDALLIETAVEGGCATVVTEDLQDGATVGGATVCHPFIGGALTSRLETLLT